jgi:hypothetical protein
MAKGENARRNGHIREYWSRRPFAGFSPSKLIKTLTHRKERRVLAKNALREQLKDVTK